MKSLLISLFLIFISNQIIAQTNYNTILNQPKDTLTKPINLNIIKAKRLNSAAHLMFAASVLSSIVIYHTSPTSASPFLIPASLAIGGMGLHIRSSHFEPETE